jgi:hypothetical protein
MLDLYTQCKMLKTIPKDTRKHGGFKNQVRDGGLEKVTELLS